MRKKKQYPIQVWFLSDDLQQSAQWLTNKLLVKSITGCMQVLVCARFYYVGIRTFKFYKHFFSADHKSETMDRLFPLWPMKQKPLFNTYKTKLSKWCRTCREHYNYIAQYMDILLQEYEFRYGKPHGLVKFLDWLNIDAPELKIPEGHLKKIVVPWKVLNPLYRKADICEGYRLQFKAVLENDGGVKIADYKKRDIPEFLCPQDNKWME